MDLCWHKWTAGHITSLSRVGCTLVPPSVDFLLPKELKEHKEKHAPSESDASVAPPLGLCPWHGGSVAHAMFPCACVCEHKIRMRQKDFIRPPRSEVLLRLRPATGHAAVTATALHLAEIGKDIDAECRVTQKDSE